MFVPLGLTITGKELALFTLSHVEFSPDIGVLDEDIVGRKKNVSINKV